MDNPFSEKKKDELMIFDGALGTEIEKRSKASSSKEIPGLKNLSAPELVEEIHTAYSEAGADFLTTNTFSANPFRLRKIGSEDLTEEINRAGAELAKKAAAASDASCKEPLVAGSIGPSGENLLPTGDLYFDELKSGFRKQAEALKKGGADWIIIETMDSLREAKAALVATKETSLPVICSMTYDKNAITRNGTAARSAALVAEKTGADVIGANCGTGPKHYTRIVKGLRKFTSKPILVEPNAGKPKIKGEETFYPMGAKEFYNHVLDFSTYLAGIGSCCGSDPGFTEKLSELAYKAERKPNSGFGEDLISSSRKVLPSPRDYYSVEVELGNLSSKTLNEEDSSVPLVNFLTQKGDPEVIEAKLALDLLQFRSDRPIGFVTRNLDFLEICLKTYRGVPPIKFTGKDDGASKICRKFGGHLI